MPYLGQKSMSVVTTTHRDIQTTCHEVIKIYDYSALEGHRPASVQWDYYLKGRSLKSPNLDPDDPDSYEITGNWITKLSGVGSSRSKHQSDPSMAIDVAPYPLDFDSDEFYELQKMIKEGKQRPKTIMLAADRLVKVRARFYFMIGVFYAVSEQLYRDRKITHKLRSGSDWDGDHDFSDQNFDDLPHLEIYKP